MPAASLRVKQVESETRSVHGSTATQSEIVAALISGDEDVFETLVHRHQASVRRLALVLLGSEARAEEAAQDVFLKLWATRERIDPSRLRSLRALLLTITRNHCFSILRRRKIARFVGLDSAPEPAAPSRDLELSSVLRATMNRLSEKQRSALALRYLEGLDYETIGQIIGKKPQVARSRVHYALKAIEPHLPSELKP
ncbi:MAG: RNA polymerase sigma factor [Myxococcota bacterium]